MRKKGTITSMICEFPKCKTRIKKERVISNILTCHKHTTQKCIECGASFMLKGRNAHSTNTCSESCKKIRTNRACMEFKRREYKTGDDVASDVYFGNVKYPLMSAIGNHGYLGVLTYNKNRDKIQCHICGKFFRSLSSSGHLKIHEITNDEYKEKFSIERTMALVAEGTRIKHLNALLNRADYPSLQNALKKQRNSDAAKIQRRTTMSGKQRRLSSYNKIGNCPLQLLDHIKTLHVKLGHVPNGEDFKREYKGRYMSTILQRYGSYNEAVKMAGYEPRTRHEYAYTEEELLEFMRVFHVRFGRTPSNTDFKRGYLPAIKHYRTRFLTVNRARALAGVPLLIQMGGWKWKEIPLTDELRKQFSDPFYAEKIKTQKT